MTDNPLPETVRRANQAETEERLSSAGTTAAIRTPAMDRSGLEKLRLEDVDADVLYLTPRNEDASPDAWIEADAATTIDLLEVA